MSGCGMCKLNYAMMMIQAHVKIGTTKMQSVPSKVDPSDFIATQQIEA